MADRCRVVDRVAVLLVHKCALARFPHAIRYHVHRSIKRNFRPLFRARRTIFHFRFASRMREQLIGCRAFRAEISLADRTLRIAFDRNEFSILVKNQLAATNAASSSGVAKRLGGEGGFVVVKIPFPAGGGAVFLVWANSSMIFPPPPERVGPASTELTVTPVPAVVSASPRASATCMVFVTP